MNFVHYDSINICDLVTIIVYCKLFGIGT